MNHKSKIIKKIDTCIYSVNATLIGFINQNEIINITTNEMATTMQSREGCFHKLSKFSWAEGQPIWITSELVKIRAISKF